jgi:hypothetical protein
MVGVRAGGIATAVSPLFSTIILSDSTQPIINEPHDASFICQMFICSAPRFAFVVRCSALVATGEAPFLKDRLLILGARAEWDSSLLGLRSNTGTSSDQAAVNSELSDKGFGDRLHRFKCPQRPQIVPAPANSSPSSRKTYICHDLPRI